MLNGRPYPLRWFLKGTGRTEGDSRSDDAALKKDVELAGRWLQRRGISEIEDPRSLYRVMSGPGCWEKCERVPFHAAARRTPAREWTAVIDAEYSHP